MTGLADDVLPRIRTHADLHRLGAANAHGREMHEAVDILEAAAAAGADADEVYTVTHKALASAVTVIARADDSSGIIGDACRRLLDLHPKAAARARVPGARLAEWMVRFQFDGKVDYFQLDPVAYAPALGSSGLAVYRSRLQAIREGLGYEPASGDVWSSPHAHEWFLLGWNQRRLAVLDHDVDAIIATHARDRRVAAWLQDTAEALAEIGEISLAIDWARQAAFHDRGYQALTAAGYWCGLLAEHRPEDLLEARAQVFRRWPSSSTAARLYETAATAWPRYRDEVTATLAESPRDAVLFALRTLRDTQYAWNLAHSLALDSDDTWELLAEAYEGTDPLAVLPVLTRLTEHDLTEAGAQHYKTAARRLTRMRRLAAGTGKATDVDGYIAALRDTHRRRPRLQREFDRAGLP